MTFDLQAFCRPLRFCSGVGTEGQAGCWMALMASITGMKWGDKVDCIDEPIRKLCININDLLPDADRTRVIMEFGPYDVLNTAGDPLATERRLWRLVDAAVRTWAPLALEAVGHKDGAAELRALPPVTRANARYASSVARKWSAFAAAAGYASAAAANAAYDAANAAADADAAYAAYAAGWASYAYTCAAPGTRSTEFVLAHVLPVLRELIEMGPHAPRESVPTFVREPAAVLAAMGCDAARSKP